MDEHPESPQVAPKPPPTAKQEDAPKRILKYLIGRADIAVGTALIPEGSEILKTGFQAQSFFVWALVPVGGRPGEERSFVALPTGAYKEYESDVYVDTVFVENLVYHVFERVEKAA